MLIFAIVLFIIAAIFGLILLTHILRNQNTPTPAVWFHGAFALIALLIVIAYVASGHNDMLILTSMILFILAALGGLTMLTMDVSKKSIPKLVAVIHPLVAVSALIILIVYVLR